MTSKFKPLTVRTGYSFRSAFGHAEDVISRLKEIGAEYAPIADRSSTFGFLRWAKLAKKAGLKPVFGVELAVTDSINAKKPAVDYWSFLAIDSVKRINDLVEKATSQFRYQPLLTVEQASSANGVIRIMGNRPAFHKLDETCGYFPVGPSTSRGALRKAKEMGIALVASCDNRFVRKGELGLYEIVAGRGAEVQLHDQHIQDHDEWMESVSHLGLTVEELKDAITLNEQLLRICFADLKRASLPEFKSPKTLKQICVEGAKDLGVNLEDPLYSSRLERELALIHDKGFEDYFFIVSDICTWAREQMMVGPARGSSCGSLVCYLMKITTINPIPFGLIFERFIDINRMDMPDIDIDFSDTQRHRVFEYINNKYGRERVARLGTVAFYKPRSILTDGGTALNIPKWMCEKVSESIIERSSGDSRAMFTFVDTLRETEHGRDLLEKHPAAADLGRLEGHPRHYSQHAAGIVVSRESIANYVAMDSRTGVVMCDKKDAEDAYNLLKIDALGLTQLSVFEQALESAGLHPKTLESIPLDDPEAIKVFNDRRFSGIFQFSGLAVMGIARQFNFTEFNDVVAVTALARPGPLTSGAAVEWLRRKNGDSPIRYPHALFEPYMRDTMGVVIYQEQVMEIGRNVGDLSWEDVTALRKAMSKSLGKEYFDQFGDRWKNAAERKGIDRAVLDKVWDDLCAYGAWAFNKSHSVAYGLISYWCAWLKAHHPFEFAAATLSHQDSTESQIQMLREMKKEGYDYIPFDIETSGRVWTSKNTPDGKKLVGPLSMVKGIGPKAVECILGARSRGEPIPDRYVKVLSKAKTDIESVYPIEDRIRHLMPDPRERNIHSPITKIGDLTEDHIEEITALVIGVAVKINPRDENEVINVAKRGYKIKDGKTTSLNLQMQDDSGVIYCKIGRWKYDQIGKPVVERGRSGSAIYAVKGRMMAKRRFLLVDSIRYIGDMEQ